MVGFRCLSDSLFPCVHLTVCVCVCVYADKDGLGGCMSDELFVLAQTLHVCVCDSSQVRPSPPPSLCLPACVCVHVCVSARVGVWVRVCVCVCAGVCVGGSVWGGGRGWGGVGWAV